jgi:hypothetical protein
MSELANAVPRSSVGDDGRGRLKRPRAKVARLGESAEFAQDSIGGWTIKKPKEPSTLAVVC